VEKILKLYQPVYGPMTWQVIFEASKGVSTEFPGQVRNAPFTPGEVAEAIRRLVKNGKARIQSWRKLDYAPPDLNVKDCTAKFCEPFFELGPASLLRDKGGKGKGRRNPRRR
jgi:hypothetical protein